jgi:membrane-bound lytic murein transglycosylase A
VFYYGSDPVAAAHLIRSLEKFREFTDGMPSPEAIREFIRTHYDVYGYAGDSAPHKVLFTGYYEPLLNGSRVPTPTFCHPVYERPKDLVEIDNSDVPTGGNEKTAVGRREGTSIVPYYTRREISEMAAEALPAEALLAPVIAWVEDPVALFFLQIQGSGKIRFTDGKTLNVHYRISNGHPYKSIGKYLIDNGKLEKEAVSMQSIRKYLYDHPDEMDEIFNYNPRYVFFETTEAGPTGCFGIELTPGRSLALDRQMFPAASLAFVQAEKPVVGKTGEIAQWVPFSRFFLNQDTGSAIKGPGRADIFWGNGPYAEVAAGYMKHPGKLFFLVLKPGI